MHQVHLSSEIITPTSVTCILHIGTEETIGFPSASLKRASESEGLVKIQIAEPTFKASQTAGQGWGPQPAHP